MSSDWSQGAARKFSDKQDDLQKKNKVLDDQGAGKWQEVVEVFTQKVEGFNRAIGNKQVLTIKSLPPGGLQVTRKDSQALLTVTSLLHQNRLDVKVVRGLPFEASIEMRVDDKYSPYFSDSAGHAIEIEVLVEAALDALLEITQ